MRGASWSEGSELEQAGSELEQGERAGARWERAGVRRASWSELERAGASRVNGTLY